MSIECKDLSFSYFEDKKNIISDLSCSFEDSKITILTGASGCGKSTLLYLMAGIYPKNAGFLKGGSVMIDGKTPKDLLPNERCRLVGMMFQNPELQFCMDTVYNEMVFCLENICALPEEMDIQIEEALDFCEISHLKDRILRTLSGGEKQKVMLACIVMLKPKWLLLDEPFANIDNASAALIASKIRQLSMEGGMGIVAVDHRLENWVDVADEIRIMEEGRLSDLIMDPKNLDEELLEKKGIIVPGGSYGVKDDAPKASPPVLKISHLQLRHENKTVLRDVNVEFSPGHIYAIVGESGCGKSSLFGALSGIYPYEGEIILDNRKYHPKRRRDIGQIGFVTQNPQDQFVADTVRQEIMVSIRDKNTARSASEEILRKIKLWRYRDVSAYLLSQGQQRRLGAAALMAYKCKVLICDEPTYAQDRNNTIAIMDSLCKMAREENMALIFSTHDRTLADDYADEVLTLKEGCLDA